MQLNDASSARVIAGDPSCAISRWEHIPVHPRAQAVLMTRDHRPTDTPSYLTAGAPTGDVVPPEHPDLLTPASLADRWHVSTGHLANLRHPGEGISYVKIGSRVAYRYTDVVDYENAHYISTVRTRRDQGGRREHRTAGQAAVQRSKRQSRPLVPSYSPNLAWSALTSDDHQDAGPLPTRWLSGIGAAPFSRVNQSDLLPHEGVSSWAALQ